MQSTRGLQEWRDSNEPREVQNHSRHLSIGHIEWTLRIDPMRNLCTFVALLLILGISVSGAASAHELAGVAQIAHGSQARDSVLSNDAHGFANDEVRAHGAIRGFVAAADSCDCDDCVHQHQRCLCGCGAGACGASLVVVSMSALAFVAVSAPPIILLQSSQPSTSAMVVAPFRPPIS